MCPELKPAAYTTHNATQPLTVQSEIQACYASVERATSLHTSRFFSHFQTCSLKFINHRHSAEIE